MLICNWDEIIDTEKKVEIVYCYIQLTVCYGQWPIFLITIVLHLMSHAYMYVYGHICTYMCIKCIPVNLHNNKLHCSKNLVAAKSIRCAVHLVYMVEKRI